MALIKVPEILKANSRKMFFLPEMKGKRSKKLCCYEKCLEGQSECQTCAT
jgi:hypothetical protein